MFTHIHARTQTNTYSIRNKLTFTNKHKAAQQHKHTSRQLAQRVSKLAVEVTKVIWDLLVRAVKCLFIVHEI